MEITRISHSSLLAIVWARGIRFIRVAFLLHIMALTGAAMAVVFGPLALDAFSGSDPVMTGIYGLISFYGLSLVLFAELDARSRYQNYKQAKDLLYERGFDLRIVNVFMGSACQRNAIQVAASDLGLSELTRFHFHALGYRWYNVIPDVLVVRPALLLTGSYWQKTLFAESYTLKYFLW